MDPLRIGMVCYPTYGGSGAVATELGRLLARRGHQIHFISYARPFRLVGDYHPNIIHHEISSETYSLFQGQLYTINSAVKMAEIIRNVGLDLVHVHYALPHAISAWMAMEMLRPDERVPTLTTLHGTDITLVGSKPSFHPAVQLGLDKSTAITAVSEWLSERTCQFFSVCDRVKVIHNFVDIEVFAPKVKRCSRSHYAADDEKILMHISNFRPVKRVEDVVAVFAGVAAKMKARLLLIGDGPDREKASMLADELGVADRVVMLGKQPGVDCFLPLADVFLFPSDGESFGLAALEAMACGVPVVGANAGGLPEVVADGVQGYLCEVGDVEAMTAATLQILQDEGLHQRMRAAARARTVDEFTAEKIVPRYEAVYHDLVARAAVGV